MSLSFFLSYLVPSLVGLFFIWISRRDLCHPTIKVGLFLIAQIVIVRYYTDTHYKAQYITLAILAGYAIFTYLAREKNGLIEKTLSITFFVLYLLYWIFEKYCLPLGWLNFLPHFILDIINTHPVNDKFVQHWTDIATKLQFWLSIPHAGMIGVSYIGFKLIHFFVDYRSGDIKSYKPMEFLSWLFFFPSIVAGPMIRFQDWQEQRETGGLNNDEILDGIRRIILGLFMKIVLADSIHSLTIGSMTPGALSIASFSQITLASCLYSVYLYCDFAGYSHIAIGMARFWNIRLPENFDAPYRARNLAEFWNRWHITLSLILRDYLFYPISLYLKRLPNLKKHPVFSTAIPPLITFILAGIWHGAGISFVIFGSLHGLGLAYLAVMKRYKFTGPFATWWATSDIAYIFSVILTFLYVSFTFIFFSLTSDKLIYLWYNLRGINSGM